VRQRVISSVGVVLVGLLSMLLGGPVFGLLMIWIGLAGFRELCRLAPVGEPRLTGTIVGSVVIAGCGASALAGWDTAVLAGLVSFAVIAPLLTALAQAPQARAANGAALTTSGSLYLAIPVFAAISLRGAGGEIDQSWLERLSQLAALDWPSTPRGLAWTGLVVFAIWVGDSAAYLGGRAFGRRPLAPAISPKKTVEGSLAGLVGSAATGLVCAAAFGLGLPSLVALAVGTTVGAVGQLGDLVESFLKRQAGVKDSGSLIPGHGGVLDRVDALLLAFPFAWVVVALIDGT
jgi:phosphatidate cytidylyltransferase